MHSGPFPEHSCPSSHQKNAGCHQEGLALPGLEWCHQYLVIPEHAVCNLKEKAQKGGSKRTGLATCGYTFKHTTSAVTKANYLHLYYHTKLTSPPIKALKNCTSLSLTCYHSSTLLDC